MHPKISIDILLAPLISEGHTPFMICSGVETVHAGISV